MTKVIYETLYEGTESQVPERSCRFEDKQIFFLVQVFLILFKKNDKETITTTKTKQTNKKNQH